MATALKAAEAGDERRLALVGQATFLETFAGILDGSDILAHCEREHSAAAYAQWLADPDARIWIAQTDPGSAPVGYLLLARPSLPLPDLRPDDLEVKRIYLLHRFHGSGTGQAMMEKALIDARQRGARRLLLGVYAHNHRAIAFYLKNGFVKVGERRFEVGARGYEDTMLARDLASE